jgi:hypothetical protein
MIRTLNSISAGSGLLMDEDSFYVIADDEHELLIFSQDQEKPEQLAIRLVEGQLPDDHKERKRLKPDHEALVWLDVSQEYSGRGILILPSGSKPNRQIGNWFLDGAVKSVQCESLYRTLEKKIPSLNIEGAAVRGPSLFLFHRGNGADSQNAMIELRLADIQSSVQADKPLLLASSLVGVQSVDLGKIQQSPLGFTDATADASGKIWFLAAAENTQSTYDDGEFLGALLGCLNPENGKVLGSFALEISAKPEGLCIHPNGQNFYLVTDADDRSRPALLFEGLLPALNP